MTSGVQALFTRVAPRYDLLNRLFSLGRDVLWRRAAAALLNPSVPGPLLDLACGTIDLSLDLARRYPDRQVIGCDFNREMLKLGLTKLGRSGIGSVDLVCGNGLELPFDQGLFAGAAIAFGIRNFPDRPAGLADLHRVLAPGGRLAVLELGAPKGRLASLYLPYLLKLMPLLARLAGAEPEDYAYLGRSIMGFPGSKEFVGMMDKAGFRSRVLPLNRGIVNLYLGLKPGG